MSEVTEIPGSFLYKPNYFPFTCGQMIFSNPTTSNPLGNKVDVEKLMKTF